MNKIEAIKIVRNTTSLGLKESKDLVEAIMPLLQFSKKELLDRLQVLYSCINDFHDYIHAQMGIEQAERLVTLIRQRNEYQTILDEIEKS